MGMWPFPVKIAQTSLWLSLLLGLGACSAMQPNAAPPSSFVENASQMKETPAGVPFQKAWFSDVEALRDVQSKYTSFYIAPVNSTPLAEQEKGSLSQAISLGVSPDEVHEICILMHDEFAHALQKRAAPTLKPVDPPEPDSLVIECALTELSPTNAAINVGQTVAGFFIPGAKLVSGTISAGARAAAGALATGSITMEVKFRKGPDGPLVGEIADRQVDPTTICLLYTSPSPRDS